MPDSVEDIGHFQEWGPYLSYGADPATMMTITWRTKEPTAGAWVKYGKTPECDQTAKEVAKSATKHHVVRITGHRGVRVRPRRRPGAGGTGPAASQLSRC